MKIAISILLLSLSALAFADEKLSTAEHDFISQIYNLEKSKIVEQLGQPSKMDNIKDNDEKIIAAVWQYHNINTDTNGKYYETTELEFLDDKVVMVVFMNNDGSDPNNKK